MCLLFFFSFFFFKKFHTLLFFSAASFFDKEFVFASQQRNVLVQLLQLLAQRFVVTCVVGRHLVRAATSLFDVLGHELANQTNKFGALLLQFARVTRRRCRIVTVVGIGEQLLCSTGKRRRRWRRSWTRRRRCCR